MNKKQQRATKAVAKAKAGGAGDIEQQEVREQVEQQPVPEMKKVKKASSLPALPKIKRPRKPKPPQSCACGCGGQTKGGRFLPGHDARLHGWVARVVRGVCGLDVVESTDGAGVRKAVEEHIAAAGK